MDTGFKDKTGKPIHVGDIVQIGLGISDRKLKRVAQSGKKFRLTNVDDDSGAGFVFTEKMAETTVLIDRAR